MATVGLVPCLTISICKLFTIDSAAQLHNLLLLVEINHKHAIFVEIIDLSCTQDVPGNGLALNALHQSDHIVNKR